MGKKIEYTNGELTIIWQPELCQHAGICVKTLPCVYKPKERPWIQIEYLQPIITQYFIDNKSEIWLLFLIAHSKR